MGITSVKKKGLRDLLPRAHPISWWMLLITTLAILMNSIDRIILPTLLPAIMDEFSLTEVQAGWLNSLAGIGIFLGALVFGFVSDYMGTGYRRCHSWTIAVAVEIASGVASAFTRSLGIFQALRVVMGFGSGGSEPLNVTLIGEWWQKENRGFAIGVHHIGFPFGQFVGPVLIGLIIAVSTWQNAFLFIPLLGVPIVIIQLIIGTKKNQAKVYKWIQENGKTLPLTEEELHARHVPDLKGTFAEMISAVRSNRNVLMAISMFFLLIWAETGISIFMTTHLTREVGLSLEDAAIISGASGLTGWIGQILWGTYSDIKGRKLVLGIILAGWIVAALACNFITSVASGWIILVSWGLFRNSPFPVLYALLIDSAPKAAASSMGLMIGISVGGAMFLVPPFAGWIIQTYGFTTHYLAIAASLVVCGIPLFLVDESLNIHK